MVWAAKRMNRPVKWVSGRSEAFLSDDAARDQFTRVELALDEAGHFLALRASHLANFGTHAASFTPLTRGISVTTGVYDIPVVHVLAKAVFTNTNPIHTYRGAGRPEAMFLLERLIDSAAHEMGMDGVEMRRKNLIPPSAMPYKNLTGMVFDSGDFAKSMDMALAKSDWDGFEARRAKAEKRGRLLGIGIANYIETATGQPVERAEMEIKPKGRVQLVVGTQDSGQGHATSYAQLISEWLGVPFKDIDLTEGDTDIVKKGSGSHSSRSMRLAGYLLGQARDEILDKGKHIAAEMLETAVSDIQFADGRFRVVGTDRSAGLFEVAAAAPEPLEGAAEINQALNAFPNGCHICELEVDPETGAITITRYTGIDDVGRVINPLLVDGQTQGGIAQGAGQALMENCDYDPQTGQLIAGSFMDYAMPRADDFPFFDLGFNEVMATNNPLGIKGAGEGG
ncbi:MAG: molybdopterin-dependent oxidoreductase, partial [Rhodospirillales bacterium]|nr:molybdopterin-dependent oxidoreductase [Rhodospirillales bacterium]